MRTINGLCVFGLLLSLVLIGGGTMAKADMLYSQPTDLNGGYFSQNDTTAGGSGNFATAYDNFTLSTTAAVKNVEWTGNYSSPPVQGAITAFTLTFWSDNSGQPGSSLLTENIPGNAHETLIGLDHIAAPFDGLAFNYSANLPSVFTATAGTKYWLSVVPDLALPSHWAWETGTGGDGTAYQDLNGTRSKLAVDLAFTLNDAVATPEPGSLVLLCTGLATAGGLLWMKKRKTTGVAE